MPEEKSFWRRYEFLIIGIATLLLIYLVVAFNQKINFLLGNELIISLEPQQKSFDMHYGNVSKAEFYISIDNVAYCRAACSYSFSDRSANNIIDKGDFEIEKGQQLLKSYGLGVKRLGSGQDIYSFDVSCHSMRSFFCLTKSSEKSRSSLVIVNYDLTETEKKLKEILKQNVTRLLELLSDVDILHQQLNQKYFELAHRVNLNSLSGEKINIDDAYDKVRISIENFRSIWATEDYIKLSQLFNQSFFNTLNSIKSSIWDLDKSIDGVVGLHNKLLSELGRLSANLKHLEDVAALLGSNETKHNLSVSINNFNKASSSIGNNTFENYSSIAEEVNGIAKQQGSIIEKSKMQAGAFFFKSEYFLKFENDLLCSLNLSCEGNISVTKVILKTDDFMKNYPDTTPLKQNCDLIKNLNNLYSNIRNETLNLISEKNVSFSNSSFFLMLANDIISNEVKRINNSYYDSFEKIKAENKTASEVINIVSEILPKNKTTITQLQYNNSINLSLLALSQIALSGESMHLLAKCEVLDNQTGKTGEFNLQPISTNITYNIASKIETNLSDNPPICCVFNICKPCCSGESCRNDPKTFPVIFLHGHSIAKENSPEFSLDAFNELQSRLQDDGYLNAGIVSLYSQSEQLQRGIWGLSGKPVTVKASYYYDAFRKEDRYIPVPTKSENIDTYSLRLKDIIEIVKQRTNKPKVNLLSHSMGGLVARRYIQIFGDEDIDRLIMMATPNSGITGDISTYCKVVGENRECQDMQENSLFINKLNDPSKQPSKARLYTIIGQGCRMKLGDGDGIVLAENAKLGNAQQYFINGTCEGLFGGNLLHTGILNIEKYPETYRIITEILKE